MLSYLECISYYVLLLGILGMFLLRSLFGNAFITTFSYWKSSLVRNVFLTTFSYWECISYYVLLLLMYFSLHSLIFEMYFYM